MAIKPITPINATEQVKNDQPKTTKEKTAQRALSVNIPVDLFEKIEDYKFTQRLPTTRAVVIEALEFFFNNKK